MTVAANPDSVSHRERLAEAYPQLAADDDPDWVSLLAAAHRVRVPANAVLLKPGEACGGFLLLLNGSVRVFQAAPDGRELTLYRITPGDICVMSLNSLIHRRPFAAEARAETDVEALMLAPAQLQRALQSSAAFREHVLARLSDRFCDMLSVVEDTAFKRLDVRLACLLGSLFERAGTGTIEITHQDIARELGTTREVVSRMLKEFERQECVRLGRGKIHIASGDGLRWFGQDERDA